MPTKFIDGSSREMEDDVYRPLPLLQEGDTSASIKAALENMDPAERKYWTDLRGVWPLNIEEGMVWRACVDRTWGDLSSPNPPECVARDACSQYGVSNWQIKADRLYEAGNWLRHGMQYGRVVPYDWEPSLSAQKIDLRTVGAISQDDSADSIWNSTDGSSTFSNFTAPTVVSSQLFEPFSPARGTPGGYSESRVTTSASTTFAYGKQPSMADLFSLAGTMAKYSRVVRYGNFAVTPYSETDHVHNIVEVISSSAGGGYPPERVEWHRHWAGACWPEIDPNDGDPDRYRYHPGFSVNLRYYGRNGNTYLYDVTAPSANGYPLSTMSTWLTDYDVYPYGQPSHRILHSTGRGFLQPLQLSYQGRSKSVSVDLPGGSVYVRVDWNAVRRRAKKLQMYSLDNGFPYYMDVPLTGGRVSANYEQRSAFQLPSTSSDVYQLADWYESHVQGDVYHHVNAPLSTECDVSEYYDKYEESHGSMWVQIGEIKLYGDKKPGAVMDKAFWENRNGKSMLVYVVEAVGRKILNDQWMSAGPRDYIDVYACVPELGGAMIVYDKVPPTY